MIMLGLTDTNSDRSLKDEWKLRFWKSRKCYYNALFFFQKKN